MIPERERERGGAVRAQVRHPLLGLVDGGDMAAGDPPQRGVGLRHPLEPLAPPPEYGEVRLAVDVRAERLDRLPDGQVDQDAAVGALRVLFEGADRGRVPVLSPLADRRTLRGVL